MSSRRGTSGLSGILLVDKPSGMTSHDVVDKVRRASGERRVGHAGTLDPMATGLLVVLVGPATRLAPYLTAAQKSYHASIRFGSATDTDDSEGDVVRTAPVPERFADREFAEELLAGFLGESMQKPPAFSAIKVGGRVAHRVARAGEDMELEPRPVVVHSAELLSVDEDAREWQVRFTVSKGTYVRSLARDLGERAGSAAHLSGLRRLTSGAFSVEDAHSLEDIDRAREAGAQTLFTDPRAAFPDLPTARAAEKDVLSGRPLDAPHDPELAAHLVAVYVGEGKLGGLYTPKDGRLVAQVVMSIPVSGPEAEDAS